MTGAIIFGGLAVLLLLALLWLLREKPEGQPAAAHLALKPAIEELFPLHCRYFPQVRQALSLADQKYLRERASAKIHRQAHAERRKVTRQYLAGLREDFVRLDRLGRTAAALAPRVNRKLEAERFRLGLQFRFHYRVVQVRLMTGSVSVPQLARLTDLLGSLAAQIEAAMAALEETSMARLRSSLSP
jgi:hypothetical protein